MAHELIHEASFLKNSISSTSSAVSGSRLQTGAPQQNFSQDKKLNALFMMSEKKFVEVDQMSSFIAQYARKTGLHHVRYNNFILLSSECKYVNRMTFRFFKVVDFGSGKGYLSAMLNMRWGLSVLGLELSPQNVEAARVRASRMAKQWSSLCKVTGEEEQGERRSNRRTERLVFSSCTVSRHLDLDQVFAGSQPDHSCPADVTYLLCGLHTCGSLGDDLVDIFRRNKSAKALVFVGCCYHLMEEKFEETATAVNSQKSRFTQHIFLRSRVNWK